MGKNRFFVSVMIILFSTSTFCVKGDSYYERFSSLMKRGFSMISQHAAFSKKHRLIIFVHGTILPIPSMAGLRYVLEGVSSGQIENFEQAYHSYLRGLCREGSCSYQPIGEFGTNGLHEISVTESSGSAMNCSLAARLVGDVFVSHDQQFGRSESVTTCLFGWGGELNHQKRIEWAEHLYAAIVAKCDELRDVRGVDEIDVELFTHSHGGTVALLLAQIQEKLKKNVEIKRLIMLGTPIQQETEKLVLDPMFKRVYLIFSRGDAVQVIDVISTKGRSRRRFLGSEEASKTSHIEITIDGKNPSHGELWSYGMAGGMVYRRNLSIYPLPVIAFMPYVLDEIEQYDAVENFFSTGKILKIDIARVKEFVSHKAVDDMDTILVKYGHSSCLDKEIRIPLSILPESNRQLLLENSNEKKF